MQNCQWGRWGCAVLVGGLLGVVPMGMLPLRGVAQTAAVRPAEVIRQGDRHFGRGEYEAAIAAYTEVLRLNPASAYAYYNRANAYRRLGQCEAALPDYGRSLQINPQQSFALLYRGECLHAIGQYRAAVENYTMLLQLRANDPAVYQKRADAYLALANRGAAIADYQKAAEGFKAQGKRKDEAKVLEQLSALQPSPPAE